MNNNTSVANAAIEAINAQRKHEAAQKAKALIVVIEEHLNAIKSLESSKADKVKLIQELAKDRYSVVELTGVTDATQAGAVVIDTVNDLNKGELDRVAANVQEVHSSIVRIDASIEAHNKNLAELRKKLSEITVNEVTSIVTN